MEATEPESGSTTSTPQAAAPALVESTELKREHIPHLPRPRQDLLIVLDYVEAVKNVYWADKPIILLTFWDLCDDCAAGRINELELRGAVGGLFYDRPALVERFDRSMMSDRGA